MHDRELTRDELDFMHGECHLLAVALSRLTGLQLAATIDYDVWIEKTVLVHAYVMDSEGPIDIRGRFELESIRDEFEVFESEDVEISEADLLMLGSQKAVLDETHPSYVKAVRYAENIAQELGLEIQKAYAAKSDNAPKGFCR